MQWGKWRNPTKCGWISNRSCKKPNPHLVRFPVNLGEFPAAHANFHRGLGEFPVCLGEFPAVRAHFQQARAAFHRTCHCFRPFGVFYASPGGDASDANRNGHNYSMLVHFSQPRYGGISVSHSAKLKSRRLRMCSCSSEFTLTNSHALSSWIIPNFALSSPECASNPPFRSVAFCYTAGTSPGRVPCAIERTRAAQLGEGVASGGA